jgi:hypothetical protein
MGYDRDIFRTLAAQRLAEAKMLVQTGQSSGAYYLAGYAIECALKARIAGLFQQNQIPDRRFVNDVYTHDLAALLRLAGLQSELESAGVSTLQQSWSVVKNWSEESRYKVWTAEEASAMIEAIDGSGAAEGLFQWLSNRW